MRGENEQGTKTISHQPGTSPRARGKHLHLQPWLAVNRNIPACAGKTRHRNLTTLSMREHPRVRGENVVDNTKAEKEAGTSPRARGKLMCFSSHFRDRGNIPACAGKTRKTLPGRTTKREHPRVRGENIKAYSRYFWLRGTSPRARGKHYLNGDCPPGKRNIPACAGKTHT